MLTMLTQNPGQSLDLRSLLMERSSVLGDGEILRGDFRQCSLERLLRFLVALGQAVDRYQATPG